MTPDEITALLKRHDQATQALTGMQSLVAQKANNVVQAAMMPLALRAFQPDALRAAMRELASSISSLEGAIAATDPVFAEFKARID